MCEEMAARGSGCQMGGAPGRAAVSFASGEERRAGAGGAADATRHAPLRNTARMAMGGRTRRAAGGSEL